MDDVDIGPSLDIRELFEIRNVEYKEITDIILDSISDALTGVLLSLAEEDKSAKLFWQDVQYDPIEEVVILIGVIRLPVGENIKMNSGEEITITEENVESLQRVVRVGIPFDLATTGTSGEVQDYLKGRRDANYTTVEELVEGIDELEKETVGSVTGFNTDDLTQEQIRNIMRNLDKSKVH